MNRASRMSGMSGIVPRNLTQDLQVAANDVVSDSDDDMPALISDQNIQNVD